MEKDERIVPEAKETLLEDKKTDENVFVNSTYLVRNAGISKQTRDLLVIKAMLYDVTESLCKWLDKYYIIEDSKSSRIFDASNLLHKEINSCIIQSIEENMEMNFTEI